VETVTTSPLFSLSKRGNRIVEQSKEGSGGELNAIGRERKIWEAQGSRHPSKACATAPRNGKSVVHELAEKEGPQNDRSVRGNKRGESEWTFVCQSFITAHPMGGEMLDLAWGGVRAKGDLGGCMEGGPLGGFPGQAATPNDWKAEEVGNF